MDRRLKIITIALSLVYLAIIVGFVEQMAADFISGFKAGIEKGVDSSEKGEIPTVSATGFFHIYLKPDKGYRSFPTTMINQLDGKPMKTEIEKMIVEISDVKEQLPKGTVVNDIFLTIFSFFTLFVSVLIPIQTFRIIRSISKNKIFDPKNIKKLRSIGYALIAVFVAGIVVAFLHYRVATSVVNIEGYSVQMKWENITLVILGLVVLMFAEVLKVSVQMKEEQDLTV